MSHAPTHLDLFSGIGGFALAAQWAGFRTVAFVERDAFCQKVLAKHWPLVPCYSDICQFNGRSLGPISLLTGGFPCQPFSVAGEQRGKEDDRYLWPEMLRVIQATNPDWIIGENVAGLDGLGLDDCISDLETCGYEVAPPFEIPACAVDARHVRNRIWIVANSAASQLQRTRCGPCGERRPEFRPDDCGKTLSDANGAGRKELNASDESDSPGQHSGRAPGGWREWPVESGFRRVADGIPNRTHRLKGLGNAIVPQVAYQITKAIFAEIQKRL